ncbi:DUF4175 domain-containing protein [Telmatospirillum sp.]|uniref:DUF4175 domain-containing protein n=1 Tax=Telmatospirillum sp. TaxID=2079197 RepID=UPI0028441FD1|nr:DUF4175 domain-containing protein [Telmatospirillum sp.]MDR3441159.1 DUF4175 domain-containing protein [Telmatospirillum sp.]
MADRLPEKDSSSIPDFSVRATRKLWLARLVLWWEEAWRRLWPLPALVALFSAFALFDVLPMLPAWLHAAVLGAFVLGGIAVPCRLVRLAWPGLAAASRRVERDSGLPHRPLQSLTDSLSGGIDDPVSQALWQVQKRRLRRALNHLSLRWPAPGVSRRDPWRLRFAPLVLLAIAAAGGWHDAPARFARALQPKISGFGGPAAVLQVWITPPAYTGMAPQLLTGRSPESPLGLPSGTVLLAVLQGGRGPARLVIDDEVLPFQRLDAESQRLETPVTRGHRLTIRQGRRPIAAWDISVLAATAPSIAFAAPPETDEDGRLQLDIEAHDDYGVAKAWASLRRTDRPDDPPLEIDLPLGSRAGDVRQASWHDLTGSPWAGLSVSIEPSAENLAGLAANGAPLVVTLPERSFRHPVARALVTERHRLIVDPENRIPVINNLAAIASNPAGFDDNLVVFLAISTSISRLARNHSTDAVSSVIDILWQAALTVEEGDRPAAQRAVDQAARDLEKALAAGASQAEIERLTEQLRTALERYFDALAEQAKRQGLQALPNDPDGREVTPEDLQGMLDQLRDLSSTGATDAARQLLGEMRQILDGLRVGQSGSASGERAHQAQQALSDLGEIAAGQRQLLDDTFRRSQKAPGESGTNADAARQETLRKRLGQVLQSLEGLGAEIPAPLGQAEQAMRDSTKSLRGGELQDSVDAQTEALARLQEGKQAATQALARQIGQGMGSQGRMRGRDPLGRPLSGPGGDQDDRSVKIPAQADQQKAREVLDELRRRAGQADRPTSERDYLQRLLKQFF